MDGVILILALLFGAIALWAAMRILQVYRERNKFGNGSLFTIGKSQVAM